MFLYMHKILFLTVFSAVFQQIVQQTSRNVATVIYTLKKRY